MLARKGGDEFAVLIKDCTERDAVNVCRSIISMMSENPFLWGDIRLHLTSSIGIRLIDHTAASPQMVHAQADAACHAAKEEGRNRYNLYHQDDEDIRRRHLEMECVNLVHEALANDRLWVVCTAHSWFRQRQRENALRDLGENQEHQGWVHLPDLSCSPQSAIILRTWLTAESWAKHCLVGTSTKGDRWTWNVLYQFVWSLDG